MPDDETKKVYRKGKMIANKKQPAAFQRKAAGSS